MSHRTISFGPVDALNPECGYQIRIENERGYLLLFTGKNPVTGEPLLSARDCMKVADMYIDPDYPL